MPRLRRGPLERGGPVGAVRRTGRSVGHLLPFPALYRPPYSSGDMISAPGGGAWAGTGVINS